MRYRGVALGMAGVANALLDVRYVQIPACAVVGVPSSHIWKTFTRNCEFIPEGEPQNIVIAKICSTTKTPYISHSLIEDR